jgi:hypothetical protein
MTPPPCERVPLADLTDYAAGEMSGAEAAAIEEHLFTCVDCGARAAEVDALVGGIGTAVRSAEVAGFVTDAVLNRLAREGVRMRSFTLAPGAVVPCAVWEDDELMVLRLRGDFRGAAEITMTQRVAGTEVVRTTCHAVPGPDGELIHATPASLIRQLPVVNVEILLTAMRGEEERSLASYTLTHAGPLRR